MGDAGKVLDKSLDGWTKAITGFGATVPPGEHGFRLAHHECAHCGLVYNCTGVYGHEHRRCERRP